MINLEAIRQRDAEYNDSFEANEKFGLRLAYPVEDRRALLAHVDRLTMANLDGVEHAETLRRAYDALAAERDALRKDAEQFMRHCYEQASVGLGVEHDCPAMYACASIIAEIGEDRGKQFDATMEQSHESK